MLNLGENIIQLKESFEPSSWLKWRYRKSSSGNYIFGFFLLDFHDWAFFLGGGAGFFFGTFFFSFFTSLFLSPSIRSRLTWDFYFVGVYI